METGVLYLIPTPIGNLGDMTFRAVEVLKSVDLIACEDTRTSLKLLNHYDIKNKLVSYHKFNETKQTGSFLGQLINGKSIAVITDAGTPAISDPASILVKSAIREGITVTCLPGATALIPALAASGLTTDRFTFVGFLPTKQKERQALLERLQNLNHTLIIYEAPHRITDTLTDLREWFADRQCVLAKELSKLHETFYRGTLDELLHMDIDNRGEFVLLLSSALYEELSDSELMNCIDSNMKQGLEGKELIKAVTILTKASRNRIYKLYLSIKKS